MRIALMTAVITLGLCATGLIAGSDNLTDTPAAPGRTAAPQAEWNFLVYLNADNDLEAWFAGDIAMMAQYGSNADINILVQVDRIPGYGSDHGDWTDTRRFNVTQGLTPDPGNELSNLGEVNMGIGPMTAVGDGSLEDFVRWAGTNYPARKTCLVFWDHGTGWRGAPDRPMKSCGWDWTSQDTLDMKEVRLALESCAVDGLMVDLISFDACLMAMLEVAWELRGVADYMTGSEDVMSTGTYPYDLILDKLFADPTIGADVLAGIIISEYGQTAGHMTMSAIDLSKVEPLVYAAHRLACAMVDNRAGVIAARDQAQEYGFGAARRYHHVDLHHFAELLTQQFPSGPVNAAANEVMNNFQCVMHNLGTPGYDNGLAVYIPKIKKYTDTAYNGDEILFARDTLWDAFVRWYWEIPWLECRGLARPGDSVEIRACGPAGASVALFFGRSLLNPAQSTPYGDLYLAQPFKQWAAGALNTDGIRRIRTSVPAAWIPGDTCFMQALVGAPGGSDTVFTNLLTVEVE